MFGLANQDAQLSFSNSHWIQRHGSLLIWFFIFKSSYFLLRYLSLMKMIAHLFSFSNFCSINFDFNILTILIVIDNWVLRDFWSVWGDFIIVICSANTDSIRQAKGVPPALTPTLETNKDNCHMYSRNDMIHTLNSKK